MCLYSKRWLPKLALHDIPIRKQILVGTVNDQQEYYAPVQGTYYGNKLPLKITPNKFWVGIMKNPVCDLYTITQGVIHCWKNNYLAIQTADHFVGYIPKGTLYWEGIDGDLAAKKIIILKKEKAIPDSEIYKKFMKHRT